MGNTFDQLFRNLHKVGDEALRGEMHGLLTQLQRDIQAKQGQLETLQAQVGHDGGNGSRSAGILYDPPI